MNKGPKPAKKGDLLTSYRPKWHDHVDNDDYIAALDFLSLVMEPDVAAISVDQLRDQDVIIKRKAKDLLRAARLPLLDRNDEHVMLELVKIATGVRLSPVLYLRGNSTRHAIIADGYHRICAAQLCDPGCEVPLKIV
jgi:hypothetical protein